MGNVASKIISSPLFDIGDGLHSSPCTATAALCMQLSTALEIYLGTWTNSSETFLSMRWRKKNLKWKQNLFLMVKV